VREVAVGDAELGVLAAERRRLVGSLSEVGEAELVPVGHLLVLQREERELEPVARDVSVVAVVDEGGGGGRRERDGGRVRRRRGEAEAGAEGGGAAEQGVVGPAGEVARGGDTLVAESEGLELQGREEAVSIRRRHDRLLHDCYSPQTTLASAKKRIKMLRGNSQRKLTSAVLLLTSQRKRHASLVTSNRITMDMFRRTENQPQHCA
jgi:hypothetical protein